MNQRIGFVSGIVTAAATGLFLVCLAVGMAVPNSVTEALSYGGCTLLSWAYLAHACVNCCVIRGERRGAACVGAGLAGLYALCVTLVYYTQLTSVRLGGLPPELASALSFVAPGSWLFNIDLLGYGLMALSTLFVGLSLSPAGREEKALKAMLLAHGVFAVCMLFPLFPLPLNQGSGGQIALLCWCLYFLPVGVLSARRFRPNAAGVTGA